MTSKEFLQQYQDANRQINAKLDQIHRLRELATKTTQSPYPRPGTIIRSPGQGISYCWKDCGHGA